MNDRSKTVLLVGALAVLPALTTPSAARAADATAEARALLEAFVKPGADPAALTAKLRPAKADYDAVFVPEAAAQLRAAYDPAWDAGGLVVKGKPDQTAVLVWSATSEQLKAWAPAARDRFPGGYQGVARHLRPGVTLYAFKFVRPGESLGMAYDGLVKVDGRWRIFPKPFRVLR